MKQMVDVMSWLGRAFAAIAGIATFLVMLMIAADVVLRFAGSGVPGTLEIITYYLMVIVAFVALGHLERQDGMISVDVVYGALNRSGKRWMRIVAGSISTIVLAGVSYASIIEALAQFRSGSYVTTLRYDLPIWPAYFLVPLAFGLATVMSGLRVVISAIDRGADPYVRRQMGLADLVEITDENHSDKES